MIKQFKNKINELCKVVNFMRGSTAYERKLYYIIMVILSIHIKSYKMIIVT